MRILARASINLLLHTGRYVIFANRRPFAILASEDFIIAVAAEK